MTRNFWLGLVFFTFIILLALHKQLIWLYWKYKRLTSKEQAFDLLSKHSFIEITGSSGIGKSWGLSHVFRCLEGVKFTNMPTPNSIYTLNEEIIQNHMIGKWGVPHRWYYFLDDINTFQQWSKDKLGPAGYIKLQNYVARAAKLGGVFIWTNNGAPIDPVFATNKNTTWEVKWHYSFLNNYSLLAIRTHKKWYNILPTIIAIDNEEIKRYYDRYWNVPREHHENFLDYTSEGMDAKELKAIKKMIKDTNGEIDFNNETIKLIEEFVKLKKKEMRDVYKNKKKKDNFVQDLKQFISNPNQKITYKEVAEWEKEGKFKYVKEKEEKKNSQFNKKTKQGQVEDDLDQTDQDLAESNE